MDGKVQQKEKEEDKYNENKSTLNVWLYQDDKNLSGLANYSTILSFSTS